MRPMSSWRGSSQTGRCCCATRRGRIRMARCDEIAGICNEARNVFGLMPHPEHAVDPLTGSTDGLKFFESIRAHVADGALV